MLERGDLEAAPFQILAEELTYDGVVVDDQNGLVHSDHLSDRRERSKAVDAFQTFPE
jgi:hypothetical protein